jgi:apolipoprotein D and lipocalin family protein
MPDLRTVEFVDIPRFMGAWYVVANIPTRMERHACNAIEHYSLRSDGHVDIEFSFNRGRPDGKRRRLRARGFVQPGSNAKWRVQFVWPIRLPYLVIYLDVDYRYTLIGYPGHKYLWIMSRESNPGQAKLEELISIAVEAGYDRFRIQPVLQDWRGAPS